MNMYKAIKGYEGLYEIGSDGKVVSIRFGKRKLMKPSMWSSGYLALCLKKDGKPKSFSIHRLLAIHFIENPNNLPQINHINGNKLDNRIENLEWVTQSENIQHMYDTGLKTYQPLHYKGKFGGEHNRSKSVRCIETGVIYGSMSEAERMLNIGQGCVSYSIFNKTPTHKLHFEIAS